MSARNIRRFHGTTVVGAELKLREMLALVATISFYGRQLQRTKHARRNYAGFSGEAATYDGVFPENKSRYCKGDYDKSQCPNDRGSNHAPEYVRWVM